MVSRKGWPVLGCLYYARFPQPYNEIANMPAAFSTVEKALVVVSASTVERHSAATSDFKNEGRCISAVAYSFRKLGLAACRRPIPPLMVFNVEGKCQYDSEHLNKISLVILKD